MNNFHKWTTPPPHDFLPSRAYHFWVLHGVENSFLELVEDEMQVLQFVLDFYQTPYGRNTSRTGGLAHPVNILVFLVHFEINDHSNKLVETRGVADMLLKHTIIEGSCTNNFRLKWVRK